MVLTFCLLGCGESESGESTTVLSVTASAETGMGDGETGGKTCEMPGGELCSCTSDAECLNGLVCLSDVCVRSPDPGTTGASTSASTSANTSATTASTSASTSATSMSTTATTADTSSGDTGAGGCVFNNDCAADEICEPDGDCDAAHGHTFIMSIDEFCLEAGCPADVAPDCQPEFYFEIYVDGVEVYEWPYYDNTASCVYWSAYPWEGVINANTVIEIRFWDYDSASPNDFMTKWCSAYNVGGDCQPVTAEDLHNQVLDNWTDDNGNDWSVLIYFWPQ